MLDPNRIALPNVPRELSQLTGRPVGYSRLYKSVLEGLVPAERDGSRWFMRRADLPAVASALGLMPAPRVEKPGRPRRSSATVEQAVA